MFWETFIKLCASNGTKPNPVAAKLGLSSGSITKWKNGAKPNDTTLQKIADYFGVSVDYLLTGEPSSAPISDDDLKFALFGGDKDIPDNVLEEVKAFAKYAKERYGK